MDWFRWLKLIWNSAAKISNSSSGSSELFISSANLIMFFWYANPSALFCNPPSFWFSPILFRNFSDISNPFQNGAPLCISRHHYYISITQISLVFPWIFATLRILAAVVHYLCKFGHKVQLKILERKYQMDKQQIAKFSCENSRISVSPCFRDITKTSPMPPAWVIPGGDASDGQSVPVWRWFAPTQEQNLRFSGGTWDKTWIEMPSICES